MRRSRLPWAAPLALALVLAFVGCGGSTAADAESTADRAARNPFASGEIRKVVDQTIRTMMEKNGIPGMAVGVTVTGHRHIYSYGLAAKAGGRPVSDETVFELGSISKTFTATMAAYAEERGRLSLADRASEHLPALAGSSFDRVSLLDLATYTAGGLPLQFPEEVTDESEMTAYFREWQPSHPVGTRRLYSNPSVGLFGHLAASSMGQPFEQLMERRIFPALGLDSTFIEVPESRMDDYAFGYTDEGEPTRVSPGVLDSETYGVKSTAPDMVRFLEEQMGAHGLSPAMRRAIDATHRGFYRVHGMEQGLGWEMYPYPTKRGQLLVGNSEGMLLAPNDAVRLSPPLPPRRSFLANKTGSTDGFGAYAAFVPDERVGVVLLANKNYPIPARVRAGHRILTALEQWSDGDAGA